MSVLRLLRRAAVVPAVVLAFSGCASRTLIESRPIPPGRSAPIGGTAYYLPKKLLKVQVWRFSTRQPVLDAKGAPALDESGTPKTVRVLKHFAVHADDGTDEVIVPDIRHHYVIVPQWDTASHDTLEVCLTPDGLLTKVSGTTVDETAGIVRAVVELVKLAAGVPPAPTTMRGLTDALDETPRFVAGFEFDPIDPVDSQRVRSALAGYGITLTLTRQADCPVATSGPGCCTTCATSEPGIYYRLPIPYRMTLSPAGVYRKAGVLGTQTGEWESLEGGTERTVLLPNEAVCMFAPVTRAAFVISHTTLTFERGMLTSVGTDKPSELLGFVRIPLDAASAILAIPAELLTVRIKQLDTEKSLLDARAAAQKAEIEQQIALLDAMRRLHAAQVPDPNK